MVISEFWNWFGSYLLASYFNATSYIWLLFQATFHFRTFLDDDEKTEIDDSKKLGEPFVLLYGKKFKLEVWEGMIETMRVDEIASFHCKHYVRDHFFLHGRIICILFAVYQTSYIITWLKF